MVEYLEIVIVAVCLELLDGENVVVNSPEILYRWKIGNGLLLTSPFRILPIYDEMHHFHILNGIRTAFIPQRPGTVQLILSNERGDGINTFSAGIVGNNSTTLNNSIHLKTGNRGYFGLLATCPIPSFLQTACHLLIIVLICKSYSIGWSNCPVNSLFRCLFHSIPFSFLYVSLPTNNPNIIAVYV